MQEYELTVVLRPNLSQEDAAGAVERIKASIAQRGGEIKAEEPWGTHRMAQVIQRSGQKFLEGNYQLLRFSIAPEHISPLRNQLRLAEEVLRYLVVRHERIPIPPAVRVPEPASGEVPKPVLDPTSEKVPEPVSDPAPEKVPEPVSEPASGEVPKPVLEPAPEEVPKPVLEPTSEEVPKPVLEPTSEKVPAPVSEPALEEVAEPVSELDTVKAESQEQQEG